MNDSGELQSALSQLTPEQRSAIEHAANVCSGRGKGKRTPQLATPIQVPAEKHRARYASRPRVDTIYVRERAERSGNEVRRGLPARKITCYHMIPAAPPPPERPGSKAAQRRLKQLAKTSK